MTTIPTWEEFIAPSLRVLSDGRIHRTRDICQAASDQLGITDEQREELVPSGQRRYLNRANWALSYLSRSGATEKPMRGHHRITDAGRSLLAQRPGGITEHDLRALGGYGSPHSTPSPTPSTPFVPSEENEPLDPTEQIETGIARIHETVAADLLVRLHGANPRSSSRPSSTCSSPWATAAPRAAPPALSSSATAASMGSSTRTPSG